MYCTVNNFFFNNSTYMLLGTSALTKRGKKKKIKIRNDFMKRQFLFKHLCVFLWVGQGKNVMGDPQWINEAIHAFNGRTVFCAYIPYVSLPKQFHNMVLHSFFYSGCSECVLLSLRKKTKVKQLLIGKSLPKWVIVKCFRWLCCSKDIA